MCIIVRGVFAFAGLGLWGSDSRSGPIKVECCRIADSVRVLSFKSAQGLRCEVAGRATGDGQTLRGQELQLWTWQGAIKEVGRITDTSHLTSFGAVIL